MKIEIEVDMDECQDHGQCVFAAPEIFRFGADGKLDYERAADLGEADLAAVQDAADICPLQAIRISSHAS